MFTYPTLLISHVYTELYTINCILPMPFGHRSCIYMYIFLFIPYTHTHKCKVVVVKLLDYLSDITAWSELEAQAFCYTCINIC